MKNKNATDDDDVPGDTLKLLEEEGLKLSTQLTTIHMKLAGGPRILLMLQ